MNRYYALLVTCLVSGSMLGLQEYVRKKQPPVKETLSQTVNGSIEPTTRAFIESLKGPPLYEMPIQEAREFLRKAQSIPVYKIPVDIEDAVVPNDALGPISIRI